jgi:superfamily II DNA or RNA helicase
VLSSVHDAILSKGLDDKITGMIRAILDSKIRVPIRDLPEGAPALICESLSIPNLAKEKAKEQKQWGWQQMPDFIDLWEIQDGHLILPRGFAHNFTDGMMIMGQEVEWDDQREWHTKFRVGKKIAPRGHQGEAVEAILKHEQGIYKAPAGSGKTVAVLIALYRLACKSIVIVNTKDIVWQWQERAEYFLGEHYPCGQIGDGIFEVSPYLTIATAQTLHSRFDDLEREGFFDQFSFMCLDECHHATAETYNRIIDRFSSRYRIGVSATPDKTGDFALATNVLGPIFHTTHPKEVKELLVPEVVKVTTKFGYGFRGASGSRRSNSGPMIDALINDPERNALIVHCIKENEGHHQLVVSKRLAHLATLQTMLEDAGFTDPIVTITGQDDNENRKAAKALAEESPCVILSTLADEAMDIPRLDRLHLPFPQKNPGLVTQQVGRVERRHPDKADAIIYDFADLNVGPLEKQWRTRRLEVYQPRGYKITTRKIVLV